MIPQIAGKGTSFKGAALYYFHDKDALTTARVQFIETRNLATDEPNFAVALMIRTAESQQKIKARAGGSSKGRKLTQPVYTYSLSWAPDEAPTRAQMLEAADETLRALGLESHQALLIAHNDEPHPHIHIIVNRVNPETGIAAKLGNDRLKLSEWALAYEKQQGKIRCEARVENIRRRKTQYVKQRANDNLSIFHNWRRARVEEQLAIRHTDEQNISAAHRAQRQALYALKEHEIRLMRTKLRDEHRRFWSAHYSAEREEKNKFEVNQNLAGERLRNFLRQSGKGFAHAEAQARSGHLSAAFGDIVHEDKRRRQLEQTLRKRRTALASKVSSRQRDEFKAINDRYKQDLALLKEKQSAERHDLSLRHATHSQQNARDIKAGPEGAAFRRDLTAKRYKQIAENAASITSARPQPTRDQRKAADGRAAQKASRRAAAAEKYRQIAENARDITTPKKTRRDPSARTYREIKENAREITAARAADPARTKDRSRDTAGDDRRKRTASRLEEFRREARAITRDEREGKGREKPPPGSRKPRDPKPE